MSNPLTLLSAPTIDYTSTPPGSEKFLNLLGYIGWFGVAICVAGFVLAGVTMVIQHRRGDGGGENMTKLAWVAAGSIIVGGASLWATTLAV